MKMSDLSGGQKFALASLSLLVVGGGIALALRKKDEDEPKKTEAIVPVEPNPNGPEAVNPTTPVGPDKPKTNPVPGQTCAERGQNGKCWEQGCPPGNVFNPFGNGGDGGCQCPNGFLWTRRSPTDDYSCVPASLPANTSWALMGDVAPALVAAGANPSVAVPLPPLAQLYQSPMLVVPGTQAVVLAIGWEESKQALLKGSQADLQGVRLMVADVAAKARAATSVPLFVLAPPWEYMIGSPVGADISAEIRTANLSVVDSPLDMKLENGKMRFYDTSTTPPTEYPESALMPKMARYAQYVLFGQQGPLSA